MAYESMNTKYAKAKIVIGAYEFNSDEYRIDSIAITTGSYDGSVVGVGNTYTAMCTITMQDIEEVVLGTALSVYFEINGTFQKFGKFWVNSQPIINGDVMTLNCHGALGQQGSSAFWYPGMYYTNEVTTIGNLLTGITEVSEMSTLEFDTDADLTDFLNKPITVPIKESSFTPSLETTYSQTHGISKQEFLAGIAILFGGNVSERNGILYFIPKTPDASRERAIFTSESYADHRLSRESYGINTIAIDYMPTRYIGYFDTNPEVITKQAQCYSGGERKRRLMLASQTSGLGANVTYDQVVECDWIGYSAETEGMYCTMQSDLKYRAGEYTFVGYNENLYAGNIVDIEHDNGETVSFYIGEMTLEWDGGFTTTISCNCDVDVSTGTYNSSTSSTVTANKVSSSAQNAENKIAFADITFSNVEDSTISGSKFIDGTIAGSKIDFSTFEDGVIKGSAIDTSSFTNGSISGSAINTSTFTDGQISGTAIDTSTFEDGTISGSVIESSTLKDIPYASMDSAFISDLTADSFFADIVGAKVIEVGALTADEADLRYADITFANIDTANIDKANIGLLFNKVGLIDRATIVDGHITGFLDAVEVNANKITAGTLVTDRLLLRGENSILYEINNITGAVQEVQGDTLNGEVLTPRTINADKIIAGSITATEIDVRNLFAQEIVASGSITGATLYGTYAEIVKGSVGGLTLSNERLEYKDRTTRLTIRTQTGNAGLSVINELGDSDYYISLESNGLHVTNGNIADETTVTSFDVEPEGTSMLNPLILSMRYYDTNEFLITKDGVTLTQMPLKIDTGAETTHAMNLTGNIEYTMYGYTGIPLKVWGGDANGLGVTLGAGGCTIVGAGESGRAMESIISSAGYEYLYLTSDNNIHFFTNCQTIANRAQVTLDTSRQFYPVTSSTTGAGSLGISSKQWATGYIYDMHTNAIDSVTYKQNGKAISTLYSVVTSGTNSFSGTGVWKQTTVSFGRTYATPPLASILPTTQFSSENIRFVSFTGNSTNGYTGMTYEVYGQTNGFKYGVRWMVVGNIKQ